MRTPRNAPKGGTQSGTPWAARTVISLHRGPPKAPYVGLPRQCKWCKELFDASTTGQLYCDETCRETAFSVEQPGRRQARYAAKRAERFTARHTVEPLGPPACGCGAVLEYSTSINGVTLESCVSCGDTHPLAQRRI